MPNAVSKVRGREIAVSPDCDHHDPLVCPACLAAKGGRIGGVARSRAKRKSSRANGKLGGRPKLPPHSKTCQAVLPGEYDRTCAGCEARARNRQ
jgi:hypothetical protein